jgi:hypothetical protein
VAEVPSDSIMRDLVLRELHGRLWHTTHPDRFKGILTSGAILPDPNMLDSDRWGTSQGPDYYPYVRTLGGVSLFDFDQFDAEAYSRDYPMSSWSEFVPYRERWGCSVWIEIDRKKVDPHNIVSRSDLVKGWKTARAYQHKIMPYIEAAHIGRLPRTAFKQAFLVRKDDSQIHPLTW